MLPMICRRGGIDKNDIGAIKIYDAHTEFEISAQAADKFSANLKRPDKEENIRIALLPAGTQGGASSGGPVDQAESTGKAHDSRVRQDDKPRYQGRPKHHGGRSSDSPPQFDKKPGFDKKTAARTQACLCRPAAA